MADYAVAQLGASEVVANVPAQSAVGTYMDAPLALSGIACNFPASSNTPQTFLETGVTIVSHMW